MLKYWCTPSTTAYFAQDDGGENNKVLILRDSEDGSVQFSGGAAMSVGAPNGRLHHSDEQYPWKYIISRLPQGHCGIVQQE